MFGFVFISIFIKVEHFYIYFYYNLLFNISLSHTLKAFVPYGYVVILSNVCSLLSSSLLEAILLISSVYKL